MNGDYEQAIIRKLIHFGESQDAIRAMLLTSSLCNPNAPVDVLSDFDVEFFFEDPAPFVQNDEWIERMGIGRTIALWHWPNEWDWEPGDGRTWTRMVYFEDGTKMDICLTYLTDLREVSGSDVLPDRYDIGYRVLIDKDGVTGSIKPPTYRAFILKPPSQQQWFSRMETFWMETTYVAKYLWRNDIMAAKFRLDGIMYHSIREVLEWSVAIEHGWNWKPGSTGRGLPDALDSETRRELIESYGGANIDDVWDSLLRTTALYRKTAVKVGEALGLSYLHDLDDRVTAFHQSLRNLDRQSGTREELAEMLRERWC